MQVEHAQTFVKTLSANDVGATGSHQAGILIPRLETMLSFFPTLPVHELNPRAAVDFQDVMSGRTWTFEYIYYNGRLTGSSSRNEYRLTRMTDYLREQHAAAGDKLELSKSVDGVRFISHHPASAAHSATTVDPDLVVLSGTWRIRRARSL